jgi:NAD-dependent deacetylase
MDSAIVRARDALASARSVAVLTGAGMSAESGIPTFRDALSGLWARFDPMTLASEEGFRADPRLVWRWYADRRTSVIRAVPNPGHRVLARVASRFPSFTLITQNVDGLHRRAGSRALELHGNIMRTICLSDCGFAEDEPGRLPPGEPPVCPQCGDWLRPAVVWFGESLDPAVLARAEEASEACDLMLVVGTSGMVFPAAGLPRLARVAGAQVVIVNPQDSELDDLASQVVRASAAVGLPELFSP